MVFILLALYCMGWAYYNYLVEDNYSRGLMWVLGAFILLLMEDDY